MQTSSESSSGLPTTDGDTPKSSSTVLSQIRVEIIEVFVHLAQASGAPRSLGEIYGFIFSSAEPVAFEDVVAGLNISSGSVSQGLRQLRSMGALRTIYIPRDRRDHYFAETDLRRVAEGLFRATIEEHLMSGADRLARLSDRIEGVHPSSQSAGDFFAERVGILRTWHGRTKTALTSVFDLLEAADPSRTNADSGSML